MARDRKMVYVTPVRIPLIQSPTPLHRLDRLSSELGVDLWIKRDDLTGLAMGGNKGRKLEYLMAAVVASGAEVVVTCGAAQSNFIRQLGAACAMLGIRCAAAVMAMPYDVVEPKEQETTDGGNLILDDLLGIDLRFAPNGTWDELYAQAEALAVEQETAGANVYRIPIGGSSALGAFAFYQAAQELDQKFDTVVFASSSGSTHTGLAFAFSGTSTRVLGIACDPEPEIAEDFAELAVGLREILPDGPVLTAKDYDLDFNFVGPGKNRRHLPRPDLFRKGLRRPPRPRRKPPPDRQDPLLAHRWPPRPLHPIVAGRLPTATYLSPGIRRSGIRAVCVGMILPCLS